MDHRLLCAATALALSACGTSDKPAGRQSAAEVAHRMSAVKLKPGQWESTVEIVSVDSPGMPSEALRMMRGHKTVARSCITPEQAEKPNAALLAGQKDNKCDYRDWTMAGGRMHGTITCAGEGGQGKMTMTMDGSYGADSYDVSTQMTSADMPGGMSMTMKSRSTSRRIGDCPAGATS